MALTLALGVGIVHAQSAAARLALLIAEERGAATTADLARLRTAVRSSDTLAARIAIRAIGRLERPTLITDLLPALRFTTPELRADAATAIGAAFGKSAPAAAAPKAGTTAARRAGATPGSVLTALIARLSVETIPSVRAAILDTIGRLPYESAADARKAEEALVQFTARNLTVTDRVGAARGLEAFTRLRGNQPISEPTVEALEDMLRLPSEVSTAAVQPASQSRTPAAEPDPMRDARIRRLALQALISADRIDDDVAQVAVSDRDPQMRRLAMRACSAVIRRPPAAASVLKRGLADSAPIVRFEALSGLAVAEPASLCEAAIDTIDDPDPQVAILAIDHLRGCAASPEALTILEDNAEDYAGTSLPAGSVRRAHAVVALALARKDQMTLAGLTKDSDPRVAMVARAALGEAFPAARKAPPATVLNAGDLQRLAAPRARVTIRGIGTFDLALLTNEAPATVLRFVSLAQSGFYNGLTFQHSSARVAAVTPNNGTRSTDEGTFIRAEPGSWPHVRGTVGMMMGTAEGSEPTIFINLVDNPQFDHEHTVFAQALNGIDVMDRILEGDSIETIEILTTP